MTPTIAFHGQFASGRILARDIGDFPLPLTFFDARNYVRQKKWIRGNEWAALEFLHSFNGPVNGIVFSISGSLLANLTHHLFPPRFNKVVLYETPILDMEPSLDAAWPILMIWNDNGRGERGRGVQEKDETNAAWERSHPVRYLEGEGRHMEWTAGWPPLRHAWDQTLNGEIADFLRG